MTSAKTPDHDHETVPEIPPASTASLIILVAINLIFLIIIGMGLWLVMGHTMPTVLSWIQSVLRVK